MLYLYSVCHCRQDVRGLAAAGNTWFIASISPGQGSGSWPELVLSPPALTIR